MRQLSRLPEPVYLDFAATTPADPAVIAAMGEHLGAAGVFGNAASTHGYGRRAGRAVDAARRDVAALLGAEPANIVFTAGATEADNLAVLGTARYRAGDGRHIVTSRTEHKAIVDSVRALERDGWEVTWLATGPGGAVTPASVAAALRDDTVLVAVMYVNNELGTLQPVAEIGALLADHPATFVVDAAQAAGRVPVDVNALGADLLTLSAHKFYGPKGVGALWFAGDYAPRLEPLVFGGGHERGLRSGTPPTHQIVGLGCAARLAKSRLAADYAHIEVLSARLRSGLVDVSGVHVNGAEAPRVPHIVNVRVADVDGESLRFALEPVAVSSGSACSSAVPEPSYVLRALGLSDAQAEASLRFSLGRSTSAAEIDAALRQFRAAVTHLRGRARFIA
ncbi:MAG: aminotransferase class V-fold PLP-dependent enzyme [Pseudomonadota bacterium]